MASAAERRRMIERDNYHAVHHGYTAAERQGQEALEESRRELQAERPDSAEPVQ